MASTKGGKANSGDEVQKDAQFKKYYLEYRKKIYWYIYRKISNPEESEDLTADVFMKLYENWSDVSDRNAQGVLAWLYTVARNASIDLLRKKRRKVVKSVENEEIDLATSVFENYVEKEMDAEELKIVEGAMDVLDDDEREVLTLRFEEEMRFKEIGEVLGKNEGACKMMLYRAVRKIKNNLNGKITTEDQ